MEFVRATLYVSIMVEHMFEGWERLPEGLADMAPGPALATVMASVDRRRLGGHDRVILMQAWNRQLAHVQAELYASMVAVTEAEIEELSSHLELEDIYDVATSEIRAALTWTRRAAEAQMSWASQMVEDYPLVWRALHEGGIDLPKAKVIISETCHLDQEHRTGVANAALQRAPQQTTGQLGARLKKLVILVDPDSAKTRYEQGVEERRVVNEPNPDGTANLYGLNLPAHRAGAAMRLINRLARAAKSANDPRTMDQIRADVLLDLLGGHQNNHTRATRGTVDIQVDLATLAGLSENPGELRGFGPIIADIVRQVTEEQPNSDWRYTITDAEGQVIHNGTTHRRPTAGQTRQVETESPTCVFPGCRNPASECDIDHNQPWSEGGPTTLENLAPLCRHDHVIRHRGWTIKQLRPGIYQWTSPLGHIYTVPARSP
jgi:hypothetical protein